MLTLREKEILTLVAEEYSSQQIAGKLGLSVRTVETHRKNIGNKIGTHSAIGAFKIAIQMGLVKDYYYAPT
ncbi:MAG TPA: LuxR C-terminal-related transcriptional regulator [Flavobacteriales bacterium]|nr:LuxR C-terminal-related transcriptional regulator [Flavobacteriales bacterium]